MVGEKIERGGEIRWLVVTGHRMLLLARLIRSVEVVEFGRKELKDSKRLDGDLETSFVVMRYISCVIKSAVHTTCLPSS